MLNLKASSDYMLLKTASMSSQAFLSTIPLVLDPYARSPKVDFARRYLYLRWKLKKAVKRVRWKKRVAKRKRAKKPKQKAAPYEGDYPPPRREA